MKKLLSLGMAAVLLTSCGGTPGTSRSQNFVNLLNDNFAFDAQSTFYVAKSEPNSVTPGFVVVYSDDTGYVAYDINNYNSGQSWSSYTANYDFQPVAVYDTYNDGYETFYYGSVYDRYGSYLGEYTFEQAGEKHKDLAKVQSVKEKYIEDKVAQGLSKEYGLQQEGALKIAKIYTKLSKAASKGALGRSQDQQLAQDLFHTDAASLEDMYKRAQQNDAADYNALLAKVAPEYGFESPEHFNAIAAKILK